MPQALPTETGKSTLAKSYNDFFELQRADTPALRDLAFRIRYQVYCIERSFENPVECPDGREQDAYDDRAVHSLLVYRATGDTAGTVRLILPAPGEQAPAFPIQSVCPLLARWPEGTMPAATTAEISRFTVSKQFRRRVSDSFYADTGTSGRAASGAASDRRLLPEITIGLLRAIVRMSRENEITHWCAILEPTLLRLLSRLGVYLRPIGPLVEYHGWRQPCYGKFSDVFEGLRKVRPDIWESVAE